MKKTSLILSILLLFAGDVFAEQRVCSIESKMISNAYTVQPFAIQVSDLVITKCKRGDVLD